jgi:hypothetical protein
MVDAQREGAIFALLIFTLIFGLLDNVFAFFIEELNILFEFRVTHKLSRVLPSRLRFGVSEPYYLIKGLGFTIREFFVSSVDNFLDNVLLLNFFSHESQMQRNKKIMGTILEGELNLQKGCVHIFISNHFIKLGKLINFKQNTYLNYIKIIKGLFFTRINIGSSFHVRC